MKPDMLPDGRWRGVELGVRAVRRRIYELPPFLFHSHGRGILTMTTYDVVEAAPWQQRLWLTRWAMGWL